MVANYLPVLNYNSRVKKRSFLRMRLQSWFFACRMNKDSVLSGGDFEFCRLGNRIKDRDVFERVSNAGSVEGTNVAYFGRCRGIHRQLKDNDVDAIPGGVEYSLFAIDRPGMAAEVGRCDDS
ncbi:MAG: hypothetical protein JWL90_3671 [Chthoniobacteraceae bacterium]|nr:hypothetical protein [Chthoniobacteraceae bacterium]